MTAEDTAWDADRYDDGHAFVYEYGEDVLELLDPGAGERVLDLGCGTGHLTGRIAAAGASVVGADPSPEMLGRAREAHPSLPFVRADARALPFEGRFDAVFSNATLHWIEDEDQDDAIAAVRDALRPGGRLVAELGGAGNVSAITDALTAALADRGYEATLPWYFPSLGEYAPRLERHGLEVRYARLFDRPTALEDGDRGLERWLDMFAGEPLDPLSPAERAAVVAEVESALEGDLYEDDTWIADYRRLRLVAHRVE